MFGNYPSLIDTSRSGFDTGPFFCRDCGGIARVKRVELNLLSKVEGLRNRIFVLRCRFHGNSFHAGDSVTSLMCVIPKQGAEEFPVICQKLNQVFFTVRRWDLACCITAFIGSIFLLTGLGAILAIKSLGGFPFWLPGFIVAIVGLLCFFIAALCLYKSGAGSALWLSDSRKLLDMSTLVNLTAAGNYDQYEIFMDRFCIFKN